VDHAVGRFALDRSPRRPGRIGIGVLRASRRRIYVAPRLFARLLACGFGCLLSGTACGPVERHDPTPEPGQHDHPESPELHAPGEDRPPTDQALPWSDAWLMAESSAYLDDPDFRRRALEASLTNPDNQYSRKRLAAYALDDRGWEGLPEWTPDAAPITTAQVEQLRDTGVLVHSSSQPTLWDRRRPTTMAEWVALGERVFFFYPLRPEIYARHALADPEIAQAVGLGPDGPGLDARWPGVVSFRDLDGRPKVGITCALCHVDRSTRADSQSPTAPPWITVVGRARRGLDYGAMRLAYYRDTGATIPAALAERMAGWGPGRADITDDEDEDPVAIPDLWALRSRRHLTQAATLGHEHPAALAIRQETQLLHANRERARPPRELTWALAMFLYSIEPPARGPSPGPGHGPSSESKSELAAGRAVFERDCRRCHARPDGSGDPIDAERVGTDLALALGTARGTGLYRPAPLVRVAAAGPYLHDGTLPTLEDLLSEARFEAGYEDGARGPGPVGGHRWGTALPAAERSALLGYLRTL